MLCAALLVVLVGTDAAGLRTSEQAVLPKALRDRANEEPPSASDFTPFNPATSFLAAETVDKDSQDYKQCDIFGKQNRFSGEIIVTSDEPIKIFTVENKQAVCYRDDVHKIFGKFWQVRLGESCEVPMKGLVRIIVMKEKDGKPMDMAANYDCEAWKAKVDAKNEEAMTNGGQVDHQAQSWFESKTEEGYPFVARFIYQAVAEQFEVSGEDTETTTSSKKAIYLAELRVFYENPTEVKAKEEEVKAKGETTKAAQAQLRAQELRKKAQELRAKAEELKIKEQEEQAGKDEERKEEDAASELDKLKNEADNPVPTEGVRTVIPPLVNIQEVPAPVPEPSKFTLKSTEDALVNIRQAVELANLDSSSMHMFGHPESNPEAETESKEGKDSAGPVASPDAGESDGSEAL